ncbi:hypothetical protein TCAL_02348 [Tigriopus californicus]|uniref:Fibronectin type-III domain-containing protein n=1 Tax=Tigriopus californicus TaxID=6832 RepID=A0A553NYQ2_TIGCA|nr:hypothetical protein TCAL_02348 [Tigriopus californicus]
MAGIAFLIPTILFFGVALGSEDPYLCVEGLAPVNGGAPQDPFDFQCISENWQSLNCTWKTLPNAISTNHTIYYSEDGRFNEAPSRWSNGTRMPNNLFYLDFRTSKIFRQVVENYRVIINQTNSLALEGVTKTFPFELQKIVRPDPPEALRILDADSRSLTITYNVPHELEYFPPGLKSRVFWWSELDSTKRQFNTSDFEVNDSNFTFTLENLYPSIFYKISVELLSSVADPEDERLWSEKNEIGARTLSERPEIAPNTTQGSFESLVHLDDRQVWIYWSYPKRELHNGLDFRPRITEVLEENKPIALTPSDVTKSFANFQLTLKKYSIFVTSENENGTAPESSKFTIPNHSEIKGLRPKSVTKIAYDNENKLFEISWLPPENKNLVRNYTIFYCKPESGRDRPYQCDGPLDWIIVNSSTLMANITLNSPDLHQFAVAANADHGISSGMIWATCTILSNKVVSKLKNVKVSHVRQTNVEVEWMVDCSDRHVRAYKVSYCVMGSLNANEACLEEEQFVNTTATSKNALLTGLKPYTYYKLGVSAITRAGESEMSDPEVVQTKPDKPQGNIAITTVVQNDNTISLTCGKPEFPNGEINRYRVQYGFVNLQGYEEVIPILDSLLSCQDAVLNDLMYNVEYFIQVSACNSLEGVRLCGDWTRTQVTTMVGPSSQMPAPEVKILTQEAMEVSWNRNKFYPGSDWLSYKIRITNTILNKSHEHFVEKSKKQEDKFKLSLPRDLLPDCDKDSDTSVTTYNVSILAISIDPDTNRTFDGVWSPVETVSTNCFFDIPKWMIIVSGSVVVLIVFVFLSYKFCYGRTTWNTRFFESVKDAPVPGDNAGDGTCVISSALAPRPDQQKKYQRTGSKESAQTLLTHPKRNLSGDSASTSGCESARSSEMDEIEKTGAGDTASIETAEEDNAVIRPNFPLDNDMANYQPQVGWPGQEDVPSGLGYSKVGEESNHHPLHVVSSPPPPPGGSYVAIQDLKAPKPNPGYIAFNQVAKSQRRPSREPLNLNSEDIEAPMAYSKVGVDPRAKLSPIAPSSGYIPHPVVTKPKRLVTLPLSEIPQKSDTFKTTPYVTYGGPMVESPTTNPPSQSGPYFQMSSTKPQGQQHELKVNQPDITMSPKNLKVSSMAPFNTAVTALDSSKSSMV